MTNAPPFKLDRFLAAKSASDSVWHYTDAAGLLGIVGSNRLRASSPMALNDSKEVLHGLDLAESVVREKYGYSSKTIQRIEKLREIDLAFGYILSTSREPDSLNQWLGYSGKQGYAIEIDTSVPLTWDGRTERSRFNPGWYDVVYDIDAHKEIIEDVLETSFGSLKTSLSRATREFPYLEPLVASLKHPGFEAEHEVRYLAGPSDTPKFRSGARGVVPFIELRPAGPDETPARLPIKSVRCSPSELSSTPLIEASVRTMLQAQGYADVPVSSSEVPFR